MSYGLTSVWQADPLLVAGARVQTNMEPLKAPVKSLGLGI